MRFEARLPSESWSRIAISLVMLLVWMSTSVTAQELAWKFSPDERFTVMFDQESVTSTDVANRVGTAKGRQNETRVSTKLTMDWNVGEVDAKGNAVVEQSIAAVQLSVVNPAMPATTIQFDTAKGEKLSRESQAVLDEIQPLIGLKTTIRMAPTGEILEVDIPDETLETLQQLPGSMQLQDMFREPAIKEMFGSAAMVLPEGELSAGQTWESTENLQTVFGNLERTRTYSFTGIETRRGRKIANFDIKSAMTPNSTVASDKDGEGRLLDFQERGTATFDVEAGYFTSFEIGSQTRTQTNYREKKIETLVDNKMTMTISKTN